ncbi:MAG TPA: YciI family protein [Acidimicrobiales bacterium]|nr:YciI family protein [Acidimicrobiales bacterium]
MFFVTHCLDKPGALDTRLARYDEHREYLSRPSVRLVVAGPLLGDDGETMIGSMFLTEADSKADVEAFNRGDPFYQHGVWDRDTIEIHAFFKRVDDRA